MEDSTQENYGELTEEQKTSDAPADTVRTAIPNREDEKNKRPVYVYILSRDCKPLTADEFKDIEPLKVTEKAELPKWLAQLIPSDEQQNSVAAEVEIEPQAETVKKKAYRSVLKNVLFYVALVAIVLGAFLIKSGGGGTPTSFAGFTMMRVLTGSMETEIPKGSLIITKQVDPKELKVGDDITYLSSPTTTVTHRIVAITESYGNTGARAFTTQGIMNSEPDKQPVLASNVVGKVVFHSVALGKSIGFLQNNRLLVLIMLALLIGFFAALRSALKDDENEYTKRKNSLTKTKNIRE